MTSLRKRILLIAAAAGTVVALSAATPAQATTRSVGDIVRDRIPVEAVRP